MESELELIIDLQCQLERQGPGSRHETQKALGFIEIVDDGEVRIADIGCGTGGQTLILAENTNASITAVDIFPKFLDKLKASTIHKGLSNRIKTLECSMDSLPFESNSLDIIWSEGAIYNIGFRKGVEAWKDYLKSGGYLAVSEISWITSVRPDAVQSFWDLNYKEMDTAGNKIKVLEENGFILEGYFNIAQDSWLDNYYKPMQAEFNAFLDRNNDSVTARKVVKDCQAEIEFYMNYKKYYSYGFYICRKAD